MFITFLSYQLLLLFVLLLPMGKLINGKNSGPIRYETDGFSWNARFSFILLLIVLLAGVREAKPGRDYSNYLNYYDYILVHGEIGKLFKVNEIGWDNLNLLFGSLGVPAGVFFGLVSGVTWFFFIKGSYKFQFLLPLMFFFVLSSGFYFWTYNGVRQSISIMIFFYSIRFLLEKDPLRYVLWIAVASLFHTSVIVMLPFYFITKIKFNQKLVALLYIASLFLVGNSWFMSKMIDLITFVSSNIDLFSSYAKFYTGEDIYDTDENRTDSGLGVLVRIVTTLYIIYKSDYILKKQPTLTVFYVLFFIGTILSNIFFSVGTIGRILTYFTVSFSIVIASTIYYSSGKYENIVNVLIIGVYFIMFSKIIVNH